MIDSLILRTATRTLVPLILLFSLYMLTWGHDQPGGGFSGGLVAALAFILYAVAFGTKEARRAFVAGPEKIIGTGLAVALLAGTIGLLAEGSFLASVSVHVPLSDDTTVDLGTPLLFDIGVYLIVAGTVVALAFALEEAFTSLLPEGNRKEAP